MSDTPDLNALARRYLDLWQDQMNRMANDPATTEMMTRTFSLMTKSAQAFAAADATSRTNSAEGAAQQGTPPSDAPPHPPRPDNADPKSPSDPLHRSATDRGDGRDRPTAESDGAAPAAALSGDGGLDLPGLLERIAGLEARVADLESALAAKPVASKPAAKPRKPRTSSRKPAAGA